MPSGELLSTLEDTIVLDDVYSRQFAKPWKTPIHATLNVRTRTKFLANLPALRVARQQYRSCRRSTRSSRRQADRWGARTQTVTGCPYTWDHGAKQTIQTLTECWQLSPNRTTSYLRDLRAESGQTWQGSLSAVSKPNFARKYAFGKVSPRSTERTPLHLSQSSTFCLNIADILPTFRQILL